MIHKAQISQPFIGVSKP